MKSFFLAASVIAALAAQGAIAADTTAAKSAPAVQSQPQKVDPLSNLAPTAEDYAKARAAHEKAKVQDPKFVSKHNTVIEEHYDNNRLVDVKVTPGSTEIPYTMTNRGDKPIDTTPGQDPHNTLGTPKFIQFGW